MLLLAAWLFLSFNFILHVPFFQLYPIRQPARSYVFARESMCGILQLLFATRARYLYALQKPCGNEMCIYGRWKNTARTLQARTKKKIYANESERGEHWREKKSQQKCRKQQLNCNSWWLFFCWWNCSVRASFIKAKKHKFSERTCSTRGNKSPAPSYKSKWNSWKCKEASLQTKQLHEST